MQWLLIFIFTVFSTGLMVKFSWLFGLVDKPDERRTHVLPTPRGGGLPIALIFTSMVFQPIFLSAFAIAIMGFWDDIKNLSAKFRFVLQFLIGGFALYQFNAFQAITLFGFAVPMFCFLVFIVWMTNLYNFMDGINGLAGLEAIFFSLGMAFLSKHHLNEWFVITSASLGFLVWNFPKAKIFLGDVGSQFFGFLFALMLVREAAHAQFHFVSGLILLGVFIVDATFTLVTRILTKQKFSHAHRSHAYQILWKKLNASHAKVTLLMMLVNVFWLLPCAYMVNNGYVSSLLGLLISYLPLVIICLFFKAGRLVS